MRSALVAAAQKRAGRARKGSIATVPPATKSDGFNAELAATAASILYLSPQPSPNGRPLYILNAAAFPDADDIDYDSLLSYVLARLPDEDELISGTEYEIIFFAGGPLDSATSEKRHGPGMGWYLQAYHVLSRATRKKLQRLYIVHPRTWVRVLIGVFGTIVSPKFRRKIIHDNTLSGLAEEIDIRKLLIPPAVYLHDRKLEPEIQTQGSSGRRAFGARPPFPVDLDTGEARLPRVLRETTSFLLLPVNVRTEGIFRIPPHSTLQNVLREAYDRGQHYIVWKERGATYASPGLEPSLVDEIRLEDAYSVHLAASLIKQWYRDLRDPIFAESSYNFLRTKFPDLDSPISLGTLVDLLSPQSDASPLTTSARQILTRHLFPLLSAVVSHEADNKMGAANLAILFSMCLICGSNQLEDAKISSIVKRILTDAIPLWPELRGEMGIAESAFELDLQPPVDSRNYEDPLEDINFKRLSQHGLSDVQEEHRIAMEDSEATIPSRPSPNTTQIFLTPVHNDQKLPERHPAPPLRLPKPSEAYPPNKSIEPSPIVPNRKPAPTTMEPPRYSSVFDNDGNSIHVADSPSNYGPVDGFGPRRKSNWSIRENEQRAFPLPSGAEPSTHPPTIAMPKRKAVSGERSEDDSASTASTEISSLRRGSDEGSLARSAAQVGAANLAQQAAALFAARSNAVSNDSITSSEPTSAKDGESAFRKPSWPASARPQSLAKPVVQPRHASTFPAIPSINTTNLTVGNMPKPRTPSPGLLKRMSSMERTSTLSTISPTTTAEPSHFRAPSPHLTTPRPLNLARSSVDDLRRLYEERVSTAESLARVGLLRKTSV